MMENTKIQLLEKEVEHLKSIIEEKDKIINLYELQLKSSKPPTVGSILQSLIDGWMIALVLFFVIFIGYGLITNLLSN